MNSDRPFSATAVSTEAPPQQGVLLVIDDDTGQLDNVRRSLIREGWVVLTASDPVEGLQSYREHWQTISLVLLDYYMPGLRGDQVWSLLHDVNPAVRVLWMSASDDYIPPRMLNSGRSTFVQKPTTRQDLLRGIRTILDHPDEPGPAADGQSA
ncbi:MAG TPA: response regulator [Verrucomicrobiae bacterium]|nr:response regulator [Verrucomicrobiae bacterium]